MEYAKLFQKLKAIKQQHLLSEWHQLSLSQRQDLAAQIEALNTKTFLDQQLALNAKSNSHTNLDSFNAFDLSGNQEDYLKGLHLLASGKVGCLLIAGGQGTRLQFSGPKGMFPVSIVKQKSLFQIFAEKVVAASKQSNRLLSLAIMTSPLNDAVTKKFFLENNNFGLNSQQLHFFSQEMLPFLNADGNLFLDSAGSLAEGPDGNGSSLKCFWKSGFWDIWYNEGVRILNFVLIDNPLADPFDAELIGFHERNCADITIKCITRMDPNEKVGTITQINGKVQVVEYSELPLNERDATNAQGNFKHPLANLSLFSFDMNFVKEAAINYTDKIPLHPAWKTIQADISMAQSKQNHSTNPLKAWKFEKFIFDLLPFATTVKALVYPRETCFAPLKNLEGKDSISEVQQILQANDRRIFTKITGKEPTIIPFEISQEFYYPTPELLKYWKNARLPQKNYIDRDE